MTSTLKSPLTLATDHSQRPAILPSPVRISITIPHALHQELLRRSDLEGRSLSNLCAFLLEGTMTPSHPH
jgi:hypothetical protein